jgi:hypothetical protein
MFLAATVPPPVNLAPQEGQDMARKRTNWLILVLALVCLGWGMVTTSRAETTGDDALRVDDAASAVDQPRAKQGWVKRFNGPRGLTDSPEAMVVDAAGNVYVTGESYNHEFDRSDIVTLKYSAAGRRLWTATYHQKGLLCYSLGIALNQEGEVYVTGGRGDDCVTLKYSSDGEQLWARRYRPSHGGSSEGEAVAVDREGNAYVAASAWQQSSGRQEISIVKYSPSGTLLWDCSYDTPAGFDGGRPRGMAVDAASNVYVVGVLYNAAVTNDMVTLRCDADGRIRWVKRYDGPAATLDAGNAIALDPTGNVIVAGMSTGVGTGTDYVIVKYRPGGKRQWEMRLNGPGNGSDDPRAIATDKAGNIYVTGYMFQSATAFTDIATAKFSANGVMRWLKYYGRSSTSRDEGLALAVDGDGNAYVLGATDLTLDHRDYTTIKYSTRGSQSWVKHYDGPAHGDDIPLAIGLDAERGVYVTGFTSTSGGRANFTTVKYRQ